MNTQLFLGVDGGQSSTTAVIGDHTGLIVGFGQGGPCNHVGAAEGRTKFVNAVSGCVGQACRQAGLDPATVRFASACLGFSGGPADKEAILPEIIRTDRMLVTHDGLIALAGATAGSPGIVVIAGTGSLAFGRNARRQTARAGGWGFLFGDEGGGFDLTRQALRAALRYEEGWGPPTRLRDLLLETTGVADTNDLLHRFYTSEFPRPRIAALSRLIDRAATGGDAVAIKLLHNAGQELAQIATAVRGQLFHPPESVLVSYAGGTFRSGPLLQRFRSLLELDEQVRVREPRFGPAAGALIEAYQATGNAPELTGVPEAEK